jgi:hypothetical protein
MSILVVLQFFDLRRCLRDINAQHHIAQVTTAVSNHQPAMIIATCTRAIAASTVVLHLPALLHGSTGAKLVMRVWTG